MTFSDRIIPGDKIEVRLAQQVNRGKNGKNDLDIRTCKSSVADIPAPLEVEITMPTNRGKMILFEVGIRLDLVFYCKRGLLHCQGTVKSRYKKDGLYMLCIQQRTDLEKLQRREFFRIGKFQDMKFYPITEEVAALPSTIELYRKTLEPEFALACCYAGILDISGGGIRFSTAAEVPEEGFILTDFRLQNAKVDETFYLVNRIVSVEPAKDDPNKKMVRSEFVFKTPSDRDTIVKYVYEEERQMRRTEGR